MNGVKNHEYKEEDYYLENDQRLQFDEDKYLPWSWGDAGMIHINPETGTYAGDMG